MLAVEGLAKVSRGYITSDVVCLICRFSGSDT